MLNTVSNINYLGYASESGCRVLPLNRINNISVDTILLGIIIILVNLAIIISIIC